MPGSTASGWPFTEETAPAAAGPLPKLSVVVPSFNQGRYLEEGLRSILLQGYPDLELIVMDGGSSDETVAVLRKYEPWIAHWVSAPDRGQSSAINAGFRRATGDICAWLCCDDRYLPGALIRAGTNFANDAQCEWLAGSGRLVFQSGRVGVMRSRIDSVAEMLEFWRYGGECFVFQPSTFWRRRLWLAAGGVREDLHMTMDYDLWLRFAERTRLHSVDDVFSVALRESGGKTFEHRDRQLRERMRSAYEFATSRGATRRALTLGLLRWYVVGRLRRGADHLTQGRFAAVLEELGRLLAAPARAMHERGRLAMITH
ncbi:MAG TPA: glycosyltransferase family 2 protein [Alphaproteobacteria bacterium]|nr:glycosyltransferase family 2 protein [Alphaproteobacteria bacterium]